VLIEISQVSGTMVDAGVVCRTAPPAIAGAMKLIHPGRGWRREPNWKAKQGASVPEFQFLGDRLVAGQIGGVEIIQKTAALADHLQQAAPGAVILDVVLQMLGQVVDPFGEKGHLHIRRPSVALMDLEPCYRLAFFHSLFDQFINREGQV
jgi:hypothetical protein